MCLRLAVGGWRLAVGGWRLAVCQWIRNQACLAIAKIVAFSIPFGMETGFSLAAGVDPVSIPLGAEGIVFVSLCWVD